MPLPPQAWNGALRRLRTAIPEFAFEAWIAPLRAAAQGGSLVLQAPSEFHRERVRARHLGDIRRCVEAELGESIEVRIEAPGGTAAGASPDVAAPAVTEAGRSPAAAVAQAFDAPAAEAAAPPPVAAAPVPPARAVASSPQPPLLHTFENFVVGPGNALAREASLAVARGAQPGVSPLYLAGPQGSGKSHLARALVQEARSQGEARAVYVSAESFTSQLLASIQARRTEGFRRRFRRECRLLVVEDVQFLQGKAATQLELFHTVEHLRLVGSRVVLTGDRLPREMPKLDARLASQLSAGLVAEVEPPDHALRREILRDKASRGGVRIPEDCLELLADGVRGSVRDLEGALIQLVSSASLLGRRVDRELTEAALRKVRGPSVRALRCDDVIECVCGFFGVTREQLRSRSRKRGVLLPRQLAMYLCHRYTDASLSEIGRELGRDHPSVANAVRGVERAVLERAPLRYQVEELVSRLDARGGPPRR